MRPCETCGLPVTTTRHHNGRGRPQKYCDRRCYHLRPRAIHTRGCDNCGKLTPRADYRFCGRPCYDEFRRTRRRSA